MMSKGERGAVWFLSCVAVALVAMIACRLTMVYGNVDFAGKEDPRKPMVAADRR